MRCKRLLINYAAGLELALCGDDSHGPSRGAVPWIGIGKPLDIRHRRHGIVPQRGLRRIPEVRLNPVGETPLADRHNARRRDSQHKAAFHRTSPFMKSHLHPPHGLRLSPRSSKRRRQARSRQSTTPGASPAPLAGKRRMNFGAWTRRSAS